MSVSVLKYHDDVAQLLFNHGADPNLADNQKRTILMLLATQKPSTKVEERISYLLDHFSPSPNVQDIHGLTVIHHLASTVLPESSQVEIIPTAKLLQNRGADLNMKDYGSRTPLYMAVKSGNLVLVRFLLEKGSNCPEARAKDSNEDNMLHLVVRQWRQGDMADIVTKLHKQSVTQLQDLAGSRNKQGFTPLLLACKLMGDCNEDLKGVTAERAVNLLDALITDAKSDSSAVVSKGKQSKSGSRENKNTDKSAAHFLSMSSSISLLQTLLKHSPRLDCLDASGMTPLTCALSANQNHAANALLEAGAQVDFCTSTPQKHEFNLTPLVFACKNHGSKGAQSGVEVNLIPAMKTMLEKIEKLNDVPKCPVTDHTALMFACQGAQDPSLVKLLIKKGANVDEKDSKGLTALHHAVLSTTPNGHISQVIELLLAAGANPYESDNLGRSSLHLAFLEENQDPMELLALLTQFVNREQLDKGDNDGNTVLHQAASIGSITSLLHLHTIGASINLKVLVYLINNSGDWDPLQH